MTVEGRLAELNGASRERAADVLRAACGSRRWVDGMAARRPFADRDGLLAAADSVWFSLGREDWLEAFGHHPRIGERNIGRFGAGAATASKEQSGMASASEAERVEFAAGNEAYEKKFGHVFLIFASGKSAGEMLEQLRRRLGNDAGQEMANAAREQSLITRLRLERWLAS